jgi:hypothetical protein
MVTGAPKLRVIEGRQAFIDALARQVRLGQYNPDPWAVAEAILRDPDACRDLDLGGKSRPALRLVTARGR